MKAGLGTGSGDHKAGREDGGASPEALTNEHKEERLVGWGLHRLIWVDSGFSLSLSPRKKRLPSTYSALNEHDLRRCGVLIYNIL